MVLDIRVSEMNETMQQMVVDAAQAAIEKWQP
jgi:hypothetical protein